MKKIFVIEDDEQLRENLLTLLEVEGFKTFSSDMGKQGIELIKELKPDLILCDIMLPDTDGYQIIKELKSDPHTRSIPFIFLTARAEMKDLRSGMNLGADDYLTKPYDTKELLNVINTRITLHKPPYKEEHYIEKDFANKLSLEDIVFVQSTKELKKVLIKTIVCINADAEYTELFLEDGTKVLVRKLIKLWEEVLPQNTFLRVHKSIIINLTFLLKIEKWFNSSYKIHLNKYPEPVISSRRYSTHIRSKLIS